MIHYAFLNYNLTQFRYRSVTDIRDVYNWRVNEKELNHSFTNKTLVVI